MRVGWLILASVTSCLGDGTIGTTDEMDGPEGPDGGPSEDPDGGSNEPLPEPCVPAKSGNFDLDVLYVSRLPRLPRYQVSYGGAGPTSWTGGSWPSPGTAMQSLAVVKNNGSEASPEFQYRWVVDSEVVDTGTSPGLAISERKEFTRSWKWDDGSHSIQFQVLFDCDGTGDLTAENNTRLHQTKSLALRFHVEPAVYDQFNALVNMVGTRSFEDWAWAHIDKMNEMMAKSGESVFLEEIAIEADLPPTGEHAPLDLDWDGRWGFDDAEWSPASIEQWVDEIQAGLIHELGHQIGLIDEYNLNFDWNYVSQNLVNGEVYYLPYSGIMNDLNALVYSEHSLGALAAHRGHRRGFFGEYLYDIPAENVLDLRDADGDPLTATHVRLYQSDSNWIQSTATIDGTTDSTGHLVLSNRPVTPISTPTGHELRSNPFGQVNVVGGNGLFLVEAEVGDTRRYGWLSLYRFNLEYWAGNTDSASYEVRVE